MTVEVKGLQETLRTLNKLAPTLRRQFTKDVKQAAAPMVAQVKAKLPQEPPLSGFNNKGRTGWNRAANHAVDVKINTSRRRKRNGFVAAEEIGVINIRGKGAALQIVDMAGRGENNARVPGRARPNLVSSLGGSPSRFMWPAVEGFIPQFQNDLMPIIRQAEKDLNREMAVIR